MSRARLAMLLWTLLAAAAPSAAPAASSSFGLKALGAPRGYFIVSAAPGASVRGRVRVVNTSHETGIVRLLGADATTGRTTGAVYETRAVKGVGAWLRLDHDQLTLGPGQSAVVTYTASVPSGAAPGDHLGGIVAEPVTAKAPANSSTAKHSFQVNVVEQSIIAVQLVVPGAARQALALTGIRAGADPGFQTLLVGIRNPGGRLMKGSGIVKVLDERGTTLRRQAFNVDTFVPGTSIEDPVVVRGHVLPAGHYSASVIIRWAGGHSTTLHAPFTVDTKQLRQVYGSRGLPSLAGGGKQSGGGSSLAIIAGGGALVLLLGIGGTALYFRRRTAELARRYESAEIRAEDHRPAREREPV